MSMAEIQAHRRERLKALLDHADFQGSKKELGAALGFQSGAYVRQMIDGERPITEKLVTKIETMRAGKFRGWFYSPLSTSDATPEDYAANFLRSLSVPEAWRLIGVMESEANRSHREKSAPSIVPAHPPSVAPKRAPARSR